MENGLLRREMWDGPRSRRHARLAGATNTAGLNRHRVSSRY